MDIATLQDYFSNFNAIQTKSHFKQQATAFFADFRNSYDRQPETQVKQKTNYVAHLNCTAFSQFVTDFNEKYDIFYQSGMAMNIWKFAELEQLEVKNCKVLRWLMDERGDHGLGKAFLIRLLKIIQCGGRLDATIASLQQTAYAVLNEVNIRSDIYDRLDIVVKSKDVCLFVEAKINAVESVDTCGSQLGRYSEKLANECAAHKHLLFLTRNKALPYDKNLADSVLLLSWREVATALRQTVAESPKHSAYHRVLFRQLAQHFNSLN